MALTLGLVASLLVGVILLTSPSAGAVFVAPPPHDVPSAAPGTVQFFPGLAQALLPRAFMASAAYDAGPDSYIVYDGGFGPARGSCGHYCNESWVLYFDGPNGPTAYQAAPAGPYGRAAASMVFDPAENAFVLFGGLNGTVGALNDTWTLSTFGGGWVPQATPTAPPPRWDASMIYDPQDGAAYLFGGFSNAGRPQNDTWMYRQGIWSQVSTPANPPARGGSTWAWDAGADEGVLFGGNGTAGPLDDTWAFNGDSWWPLHPTTSPPALSNASGSSTGAGDPVVFGGWSPGGLLNETWEFYQGDWSELPLNSEINPPPEEGASLTPDYLGGTNEYFLQGGWSAEGYLEDDWGASIPEGGSPPPPYPLGLTATASPSAATGSANVQFIADISGGTPPYLLSWQFGDGSTGYVYDPMHTYLRPGDYRATAYLHDSAVPSQTSSQTLEVVVSSPPGVFSVTTLATPVVGPPPLTVQFTPQVTGGTGSDTYRWSFGDGSKPSSLEDPVHTYNSTGNFPATLIVNDSAGASANWTTTVVVGASSYTVSLGAMTTSGHVPLVVTLHATVSGGKPPFELFWSFGDGAGEMTSDPTVTHQYNATGNYTVHLIVEDVLGTSVSASLLIVVEPPLPPVPPPPPTLLGRIANGLLEIAQVVLDPIVFAGLVVLAFVGGAVRWGIPAARRRSAIGRAVAPRPASDLWGVGVFAVLAADLREGSDLPTLVARARSILLRDARSAARRLEWHPGPLAIWSVRRVILLVPQFLIGVTVIFVGLDVVPNLLTSPSSVWDHPWGYFQQWWAYLPSLVSSTTSDIYLAAWLPYTLQLLALVIVLSALLAYPLGLLAGWYRGRTVDQSTRAAGVLALGLPMFVVALLVLGWGWSAFYQGTGDFLTGSLPSLNWFDQYMGGYPAWIGPLGNTGPTGFSLLDAPLHGAWAMEEVMLLKIFVQAFAVAAVYTSIFLRYVRLSTEELSYELPVVGARSRGVSERNLLWKHTSRRVLPLYVSIFGSTFPLLIFVQFVAEWSFVDSGLGNGFFTAAAGLGPSGQGPTLAELAFVILVMLFVVNAVTDLVSRALSPGGLGESR